MKNYLLPIEHKTKKWNLCKFFKYFRQKKKFFSLLIIDKNESILMNLKISIKNFEISILLNPYAHKFA